MPTMRPERPTQQLLVAVAALAPPLHIIGVRLLGRIEVQGGQLSLTNCRVDAPSGVVAPQSVASSTRADLSVGERALSIVGGRAVLERTNFSGHLTGALEAIDEAIVTLVGCIIQSCRAHVGGAIAVRTGASVHVEHSTLMNNTAVVSGGAIQVNGWRLDSPCHALSAPHTQRPELSL
jgi:hypothetical protein